MNHKKMFLLLSLIFSQLIYADTPPARAVNSETYDAAGNAITSTVNGPSRGLNVYGVNPTTAPLNTQIIVGGSVIDPRSISGSVTANAGTNLNTSSLALESGGHLQSIDGKLSDDGGGNLNVNIAAGSISASNPSVGTNGANIPLSSTQAGGEDQSGKLQPLRVSAAGNLLIDGSTVTQPISGTVTANAGTGTFTVDASGHTVPVSGVFFQATQPVSIATMPTTPVTGVFFQATQPISAASLPLPTGASTDVAQGSTTSGETGALIQGAVTAAAPSYTTAKTNPLSLNTSGGLRVDGSGVTQPVSGVFFQATQPVSLTSLPALTTSSAVIGHVIVDSAPSTAVTGPLTDAQLRNSAVPVSLSTLPALTTSSAVIGHVIVDTAPTTAVTIATLPSLAAGTSLIGKVGIDQTTPGTTNGVQVNAALPAGSNVIGHVILDSGSTTAVTGTITANAGSGTMAVSAASLPLPSGAATDTRQDTGNTSLSSIDDKSTNYSPLTFGPTLGATDLILFDIDTQGWGGATISFDTSVVSGTGANEADLVLEYRNSTADAWAVDANGFRSQDGTTAGGQIVYIIASGVFDYYPGLIILPRGRYIRGHMTVYDSSTGTSNFTAHVVLKKVPPVIIPTLGEVAVSNNNANPVAVTPSFFGPDFDTYTAPGTGFQADIHFTPMKSFSLQVVPTGAVTSWDVVLEASLSSGGAANWTTILEHTDTSPGAGKMISTGALLAPALFFRTRCVSITLGAGTSVTAWSMGMN